MVLELSASQRLYLQKVGLHDCMTGIMRAANELPGCAHNPKKVKLLVAQLYSTLCDPVDCSPPLSIEFSRQEYCSEQTFSFLPTLKVDSLPFELPEKPT